MTLLPFCLGVLVGALIAAAVRPAPKSRYHRPEWMRRHEADLVWNMSEPARHHSGPWNPNS